MEIVAEMERARSTLVPQEMSQEDTRETPSCDCVHERMSDGIHHYLHLPSVEEVRGEPMRVDDHVTQRPGNYVAIAVQDNGRHCFMSPRWIGRFSGESEAGEIAPATRLLCDWCKKHWSQISAVKFEQLH